MKQFEHGGNIHKAVRNRKRYGKLIDFSANINPLGPPEWLRPVFSSQLEQLVHYPDPDNTEFISAVSRHTGIAEEKIVAGNGTTEILYTIIREIPSKRVVVPVPSYVDYIRAAEMACKKVIPVALKESNEFQFDPSEFSQNISSGDLIVLATPNNPTGNSIDRDSILQLADNFPDTYFLIDEAFLDFIPDVHSVGGVRNNVFTINSMTKFYGVPGLRIGYGILPEEKAGLIRSYLVPWSVNSLAQVFGVRALGDRKYQDATRSLCNDLRSTLVSDLHEIESLRIYPSSANYLFIKLLSGNSEELYQHCLERSILIRKCDNYLGLENPSSFIRIAVRTEEENKKLTAIFNCYFNKTKKITPVRKKVAKANSLMFQGTCSDAGKSILTAGLCRVLLQDGMKVVPFKAQNMSLNSFVTLQGDEMGRAQVVQAQAAKLDPDCRMNPVLLKPNSDTGSQIIVSGKPVGNMSVTEYNKYKPQAWEAVCRSYDSLSAEYDVVILEGAGSPGEVNLKRDDIVNMRMAGYAQSPVILIGDIDRGGVYASFVGIMEVLAEWERDLVSGFLVNKFRGQASLLESAHEYVKMHTGKRVLGVLPYLSNLGLPEEDSVSFKKGGFNTPIKQNGIELALINLPHISNFTDVEPFLEEPDVALTVIDRVEQLEKPQAVILPGSKNVIYDLQYLKSTGLIEAIHKCKENGAEIVGICGGYQMLGMFIQDPYEIESKMGQVEATGLLPMETVIEKEKTLIRKKGIHRLSGHQICGYEIHHGISSESDSPLLVFDDGTVCGTEIDDGKVWGSYLHGIFDSDGFRRWFIDKLRVKSGMQPLGKVVAPYDLERAFDRLAECVRQNLDMDEIYRLLRV